MELCSLGVPEDQDPGPSISVGFAPSTDQPASGWINPVGSCLLHRFFSMFFFFFLFICLVFLSFRVSLRDIIPESLFSFVQVSLSTG